MSEGVKLIAAERQRQVDVEGWTTENDDKYVNNELADAAICYLVEPDLRDASAFPWPWEASWWKPTPQDRLRELVKAGALIAAAIDSELRKQQREQ